MPKLFAGIDVQSVRSSPYAVLDGAGRLIQSGWSTGQTPREVADSLRGVIGELSENEPDAVVVGVDSPSRLLTEPRGWYWDRKGDTWRKRRGEKGWGRHSEVVVSAFGLANPQWTPPEKKAPQWMQVGVEIFRALKGVATAHEVFPTASYNLLKGDAEVMVSVDLSKFAKGPKDMLDAYVAAVTVREYSNGFGFRIVGGDRLGDIILPRPLPDGGPRRALSWPEGS